MRILLAVSLSEERFNVIPDIGLGYLASLAREAGHEVHFIDCIIEGLDLDGWKRHVAALRPDVVGLKAYSIDIATVNSMLCAAKDVSQDTVTVIGGPHPSTEVPERVFNGFPSADYAFAGEGEPGWASFLEIIEKGEGNLESVPGLVWREEGEVRANPRALARDLDSLPMPAWDLLRPDRYKSGYAFMTRHLPAAPMNFTRGCPYDCTFCASYLITGRNPPDEKP